MDLINDWLKENVCHKPVSRQQYQDEVKAYWKGRCDKLQAEIDRLTAEKFCPECGCKMSLWCEKDVKERMDAKNKQLQAENAKLKEEIRSAASLIKRFIVVCEALKGGCWE